MSNNPQTPSKLVGKGLKKLHVTGDKSCSQVPENDNEGEKEEPVIQAGYQFIKSMTNAMVNPISYKDKNGVFIGINESYARHVFGLPEEKIIGHTLLEICTASAEKFDKRPTASGKCFMDVCREWGESDAKLLASGESKTHEQEVTHADGTRGIFLVNRSAFKDKNGDVLGLVTVLQDITELRISERALLESDERYRIITEQTGQLVYDNNLENNNLSLAGAVEEIFGYSVEEARRFDLGDWIQHIHPGDIEYVLKKFMQARKTGGRDRVEYRLRKKNGNYTDVEDTGTYLLNNDGKPYRVLGVVKDITEQKVIRAQLEKNKEKYKIVTEQTEQIVYDYDL